MIVSRAFFLAPVFGFWLSAGYIAEAQRRPPQPPVWADTTGESDVYPVGDAVGVYRAVLDLLYVDGKERPGVIVLWDTAMRHGNGPCPIEACPEPWVHKSTMDTATVLGLARQSPKRPRIIEFGYRIPIALISQDDFEQMMNDGYAILADRPPEKVGFGALWAGFARRYPRAWGYVALGKVGFNPQHTEALVSVSQVCGQSCRSNEIVFLKRFGNEWRPIERVADYIEGMQAGGNFRYRGPGVVNPGESQIVASDSSGARPRAESADAGLVYGAVLDRLYSFYGESPGQIVITDNHAWAGGVPINPRSRIDSSTLSSYRAYAQIHDALPRFRYRLPIVWVTDTAMKLLALVGGSLKAADPRVLDQDESPKWYAFHAKYPKAWGYISLSRVGFNPQHTQALVFTRHLCGNECETADSWFLERKNDRWYVVERMPEGNSANWVIDGLRYLGPEANPTWYRPSRLHGVVTDFETGRPLPRLKLRLQQGGIRIDAETDAEGRYAIGNVPRANVALKAKCPAHSEREWTTTNLMMYVRPGMDSTMNAQVDFSFCSQ